MLLWTADHPTCDLFTLCRFLHSRASCPHSPQRPWYPMHHTPTTPPPTSKIIIIRIKKSAQLRTRKLDYICTKIANRTVETPRQLQLPRDISVRAQDSAGAISLLKYYVYDPFRSRKMLQACSQVSVLNVFCKMP